jgi:anti-sigma factor RsiW
MKHEGASFETTEMAALYALGALSQHEARIFEDHLSTCRQCRAEVESFDATVSVLALADEQEPPPRVRDN